MKKRFLAVSAVILMTILVYLFISDVCAVISVVISILSICLGTLAYLHLWNVRLDAVSLISMLMSVGFSVDYSAHICYHYFIQKVIHSICRYPMNIFNVTIIAYIIFTSLFSLFLLVCIRRLGCTTFLYTLTRGVPWPYGSSEQNGVISHFLVIHYFTLVSTKMEEKYRWLYKL